MAGNKKPRKARRPAAGGLPLPLVFGMTREMHQKLGIRDRMHIEAAWSGHGTDDDLAAAISVCVTMTYLTKSAIDNPGGHEVGADDLQAAHNELSRVIGPALHAMRVRRDATGRVGCTGEQRQALIALADLADQLRANLPRRMYLAALSYAVKHPRLEVALPKHGGDEGALSLLDSVAMG